MNTPGTQGTSWRWRMEPGALTSEHAQRLPRTDRSRRPPMMNEASMDDLFVIAAGWSPSVTRSRAAAAARRPSACTRSRGRSGSRRRSSCRSPTSRVDGATSADVVDHQLPRLQGPYDLATLYIGANDARGAFDADAYRRDLTVILDALRREADRVLVLTLPTDLGRPRAGADVTTANSILEALAPELCDLRDFGGTEERPPGRRPPHLARHDRDRQPRARGPRRARRVDGDERTDLVARVRLRPLVRLADPPRPAKAMGRAVDIATDAVVGERDPVRGARPRHDRRRSAPGRAVRVPLSRAHRDRGGRGARGRRRARRLRP